MPYFSTRPRSSLGSSIRRLFAGGAGIDPSQQIGIEQAAATTAHRLALMDKLRAETGQMEQAAAARVNPDLAAEYAGHAAGMDVPTATRMGQHLRGVMEQPSTADVEDAAMAGRDAAPYRVSAPDVTPGQRRLFQSAIAATIANRLATGKTNADQFAKAGGNVQDNMLTEEAIAAKDLPTQNRIVAAASGKTYTPFRTNAQGVTTDQGAGTVDEGSQLAARVRALAEGRTVQARAAAGASGAAAGASNALTTLRGKQGGLVDARTDRVRSGQPATPVAPERVARMIDMTALGEYKAVKAAYDALPFSQKKATKPPELGAIREQVAQRYQQPGTQGEISDANAAIARGANPEEVRKRFRQRRGFDLPAVASPTSSEVDDEEDE
jgi:hypothetical protein